MTYSEFNIKLETHVNGLDFRQQFALAISICKKLFPDYHEFYRANNWGDPEVLIDSINLCESFYKSEIELGRLTECLTMIEAISPDTDDFGDASYALNAAVAVCATIDFLISQKHEHIISVCSCLTDTVDFKIQEDDELTEVEIDNHPMMIEAREFLLT